MSLADKLQTAKTTATTKPCKLGSLLAGNVLAQKDKDTLVAILDVPEGTPGRLTNKIIAKIIREEGFDVGDSSVDRHRRKDCGCYRTTIGR
jgi:hypothetical protein